MTEKTKTTRKNVKRVTIKCHATINPGEIRFGRAVEAKPFKKKKS